MATKPKAVTKTAKAVVQEEKAKPVELYGKLCLDSKGNVSHFEKSDYKNGKEMLTKIPLKEK